MNYIKLLLLIFLPFFIYSQDYDDVAVVMNSNSPESILVGEYFQQKNNIPDENMIYVEMPNSEEIDTFQVIPILEEIKSQIETNSTSDQINYIVTTMGCPQLVGPFFPFVMEINERSFENLVSSLGIDVITNTYSGESSSFTYLDYGYRIVSRLEAGTLEGTYRMIDRGGHQQVDINNKIVFDFYAPFNIMDTLAFHLITDVFIEASETLNLVGIETELDTIKNHYSSNEKLLAYSMFGYGNQGVPVSEFVEKTQELGILQIARSGVKSNYGNILTVFDFLEAKCHAAAGFYTYFYVSTFKQNDFYKNYFDSNMNIGESITSALSNSYFAPVVLFGDPKSRIVSLSYVNDPIDPIKANIFPVPAGEFININFEDGQERTFVLYNSNGQKLFSKSTKAQENKLDISSIPVGALYLVIQEKDKQEVRKILKL